MHIVGGGLLLAAILAAAEAVKNAAGLMIPAPVLAIVILVVGLFMLRRVPSGLRLVADFLLRHMALFFIPALVAMVALSDVLAQTLWPLLAIIVVSTIIPLWLTAWVFARLAPPLEDADDKREGGA
jgi:holin-like protein